MISAVVHNETSNIYMRGDEKRKERKKLENRGEQEVGDREKKM